MDTCNYQNPASTLTTKLAHAPSPPAPHFFFFFPLHTQVIALIEKLSTVNIQEFSPSAVDSILVLLWKVVQHPNVRQYKAFDMVNDLFGQALKSVGEEGRQYSFLRESLDEVSRSAETEVKNKKGWLIKIDMYTRTFC